MRHPYGLPLAVSLILALANGCASQPTKSSFERGVQEATLSERQVRSRLHDLVRRASAMVEAATEQNIQDTEDPAERLRALTARANFVAALQSAAFDNDPYIGLLDVWALTAQTRDYYESGPGRVNLGERSVAVLEALGALEGLVVETVTATGGVEGMEELRPHLEKWVEENPITDESFGRASVGPTLAAEMSDSRALFSTSARMEDRVEDMSDRLTVYAEMLPKQARWQAEILAQDLLRQTPSVLDGILDQIHVLASAERQAITEYVSAEREVVRAEIDAQRLDTLAKLREEREATVATLDAMHATTLSAVTAERVATLEGLDEMRADTLLVLHTERSEMQTWIDQSQATLLADVERLTERSFDHMADRTEAVATRLLNKVILSAGAGLAAVVLIGLGLLARRRHAPA